MNGAFIDLEAPLLASAPAFLVLSDPEPGSSMTAMAGGLVGGWPVEEEDKKQEEGSVCVGCSRQ